MLHTIGYQTHRPQASCVRTRVQRLHDLSSFSARRVPVCPGIYLHFISVVGRYQTLPPSHLFGCVSHVQTHTHTMAWLQRPHDLSPFSPARRVRKAEWRTRLHTTRRMYVTIHADQTANPLVQQRRPSPANTTQFRRPAISPEQNPPRHRRPPRTRACRTIQRSRRCSGRRPPTRSAGRPRPGRCLHVEHSLSAYSCSRVLNRGLQP